MSRQYWSEALGWSVSDGSAIANTTTETIIFPNITIPANYMQDGRVLIGTSTGRYSTTGTPTLRFRLRWGGVGGTVLADSGTITGGSGVTAAVWRTTFWIHTRTNGATGTLFPMLEAIIGAALAPTVGSATGAAAVVLGGSAGVATPAAVTVDLTADTALSLTMAWGTANASNTLNGHNHLLQSMN